MSRGTPASLTRLLTASGSALAPAPRSGQSGELIAEHVARPVAASRRFDAFLCYASDPDIECARELERFLEAFHRLPTADESPVRPLQICRDGSDFKLPKAPRAVKDTLYDHLALSERLIVLCSPGAVSSEFVQAEIAWWIEHRGAEGILLAITAGRRPDLEPQECIPGPLLELELHTSMRFDLRAWRGRIPDGVEGIVRNFDDGRVALAAEMYGRTAGELQPVWQRELRAQDRRRKLTLSLIVLLSIAVAVAGVVAWKFSERARRVDENARLAQRKQNLEAFLATGRDRVDSADPVAALLPLLAAEQLGASEPVIASSAGLVADAILRVAPRLKQALIFSSHGGASPIVDASWISPTLIAVIQKGWGVRRFDAEHGTELGDPLMPRDCTVISGAIAADNSAAVLVCESQENDQFTHTIVRLEIPSGRVGPRFPLTSQFRELQVNQTASLVTIAVESRRRSPRGLLLVDTTNGVARELREIGRGSTKLSPSGKHLLVRVHARRPNRGGPWQQVWQLDPLQRLNSTEIAADHTRFSPDGTWFVMWDPCDRPTVSV